MVTAVSLRRLEELAGPRGSEPRRPDLTPPRTGWWASGPRVTKLGFFGSVAEHHFAPMALSCNLVVI